MSESALNVSASRADNSSVGRIETEAYLLANKRSDDTVVRMVKMSADPIDDASKLRETEINTLPDADPTVTNLKPIKSSIARNLLKEKETTGNFIGDVTEAEEVSYFVTGSSYKGSWDALGMAGVGRYVMPHGTAYEGEIRDGMFHGQGSLYWPKKNRLDVVHLRGKLRGHRYTFEDGLVYQDEDWSYCKFPDRRFYESVRNGLRPGGRTLKTAKQPTKVLPSGCYDAGDGAFDPKTFRISSYDNTEEILRVPTKEESEWIVKNCRKSWTEPTGYRPSLNENWSEGPPELPYHIALSEDSPDPWWKRLTTFNRQFDTTGAEDDNDICNRAEHEGVPLLEICLCGQYVILGEPCHCAAVGTPFDDEDDEEEMNDSLPSVSNSSDHFDVKSVISQGKSKSIRIIDQRCSRVELSAGVPEFAETNTNDTDNGLGNFSDYDSSVEFVVNHNDLEKLRKGTIDELQMEAEEVKSKHGVGQKVLRKPARNRHGEGVGSGSGISHKAIVKKLAAGNNDEIAEGLKFMIKEEVATRRNEEMDGRREYTPDEKNRKEEQEFMRQSDVKKNRVDEVRKELVTLMQNEDQRKIDEEKSKEGRPGHETADGRKDIVTKETRWMVGDESDGAKVGGPEDQLNESTPVKAVKEGREEKKDPTKPPLEDHDHTVASVRREKVPIAMEPETSNARRMESEGSTLLPKGETSGRDLPSDRRNEKAIGSVAIDGSAIREGMHGNNVVGSVSTKTLENITINDSPLRVEKKRSESIAKDNKLHKVKLDEGEEIADAPENMQSRRYDRSIDTVDRSVDTVDRSKLIKYTEVSKASIRSRDKTVTTDVKFSKLRRNARPREIDEEEIKTLKKKPGSLRSMASGTMSKDSRSRDTDEEMATEGSCSFPNNDLPILEKLHNSLAALSSDEQKATEQKEIIEIYSKFSRKEKSEAVKCANANVWRLSGAAQDGSRIKIEDLLLRPILAAPKCELFEWSRKPCVVKVCKPTVPEVLTSASRCRKEFPFDIPAKQSRSSPERTGCRNK